MKQLNRPSKIEQAAALMLTVFEANPGVVITRREIEGCLPVKGFSASTRQRALNYLVSERGIRHETDPDGWMGGGKPTIYWLK